MAVACVSCSKDPAAVPAPSPVAPAPVAAIDAGPTWPNVACDKLLSAGEIASLCHLATLTAQTEAGEGKVTDAFPPNPISRNMCIRSFEVPGRGTVGAFALTAYADAVWPRRLAEVWGWTYGGVTLKTHANDVYTRRDLDGTVGRYQWNLFETDQHGEAPLCTDDQWRTLATRLISRL